MGTDDGFGRAYAKAQLGAGQKLPTEGVVFISVRDEDKSAVLGAAKAFSDLGFSIMATRGTSEFLTGHGINNTVINKVSAGRPHVVDAVTNRQIQIVINTGTGDATRKDGYLIRRAAIKFGVPYATTIAGASAMCRGIAAIREKALSVTPIQDYYGKGV
jgi:carbamoyl-phosphate synthase large subunit